MLENLTSDSQEDEQNQVDRGGHNMEEVSENQSQLSHQNRAVYPRAVDPMADNIGHAVPEERLVGKSKRNKNTTCRLS